MFDQPINFPPRQNKSAARPLLHHGKGAVAAGMLLAAGLIAPVHAQATAGDDYMLPALPSIVARLSSSIPGLTASVTSVPSTGGATAHSRISLLVLHDPAMPQASATIMDLLTTTNTIFAQSGVALTFELAVAVPYSAGGTNSDALRHITDDEEIGELRTLYGADMVTLLRPYRTAHAGCGQAWIIGWDGFDPFTIPGYAYDYAYSVVSVGSDGSFFCRESTLAHELGHNFGAVHERGNTSLVPRLPYAYGWGFDGSFGTVMAFINPKVPYFSTPDIGACNGFVCGDPIEGDVARAINEVRDIFAALSPNLGTPEPPVITGSNALVDSITLDFTTPADGGSAILDYTARCNQVEATALSAPITVLGLQPETGHSCTVSARNQVGASTASESRHVTTLPIPRPTIARIDEWDSELTVRIETAEILGSYQVLEHIVTCGALSGATLGDFITFSHLANGTAYPCSVTAVTTAGNSSASAVTSATPAARSSGINLILIEAALDKQ